MPPDASKPRLKHLDVDYFRAECALNLLHCRVGGGRVPGLLSLLWVAGRDWLGTGRLIVCFDHETDRNLSTANLGASFAQRFCII